MKASLCTQQNYINAIGEQFNFLDNLDYMYKDSSSESETPGPFSRSFQVLDQNEDQETEEREEDRDRYIRMLEPVKYM